MKSALIKSKSIFSREENTPFSLGRIIKVGVISVIVISFTANHLIARVVSEPRYVAPQARLEGVAETGREVLIDDVVAAEVAAIVAEETKLPITQNVTNRAITLDARALMAAQVEDSSTPTVEKPQLVVPEDEAASGVQTITAKDGDTIASLAARYGISEDTIRWANDIAEGASISSGDKLKILPVSGVLHSVQDGETISGIASRYGVSEEQIKAYNDLEVNKFRSGRQLIIPGGKQQEVPAPANPNTAFTSSVQVGGAFTPVYAGNRYDYGYCTWYTYNRRAEVGRPIPSLMGHASAWAYNASRAGFRVNNTPEVGAVFQTAGGYGGYGHVAFVEAVHSNGSITISEMNYAGWNVKSSRTISASEVSSYNYIH